MIYNVEPIIVESSNKKLISRLWMKINKNLHFGTQVEWVQQAC